MQFQSQVDVVPVTCRISGLMVLAAGDDSANSQPILPCDRQFHLQVQVEIGGAGAIALVPLGLCIQVDFYAIAFGYGLTIDLGSTNINTTPQIFTYTPTLTIASPATIGLAPQKVYQIKALVRIGATNYPALIVGYIEGLMLQIY